MYGRRWQQRERVGIAESSGLPYNAERRAPSARFLCRAALPRGEAVRPASPPAPVSALSPRLSRSGLDTPVRKLRVPQGVGVVPGSVGTAASGGRNARPSPRGFVGSCPRLAATRLAAALLILAAPSLVLVPLAVAEEVSVWSATLNPVVISASANVYGCKAASGQSGTKCTETSVLSDSTFDVPGTEYQITYMASRPDTGNRYRLTLSAGEKSGSSTEEVTEGALDHLVLYVGSRRLPFAEAATSAGPRGEDTNFNWYSLPSRIAFSVGDPVQLRITARVVTGRLEKVDPVEKPDGRLDYRFDLKLRERIWMPSRDMREHAFDVTNGRVVQAQRIGRVGRQHIDGRARKVNKHWRMTVRPTDPDEDISISLPSRQCSEQGAVCTPDAERLKEKLMLDISSAEQLTVSVADTTASEDDEYLKFDVTLSRPAEDWVEVYFKSTTEGTATEGGVPGQRPGGLHQGGRLVRLRSRRDQQGDVGPADRRRRRRRRRDGGGPAHRGPHGRQVELEGLRAPGSPRRRQGDGHDQQRRRAAAGAARALRARGGGARGRARGRAHGGAARAGLYGPFRGPRAAARDGARCRARLFERARRHGRRGSAGRRAPRSAVRRAGGGPAGFAGHAGPCRRRRTAPRGTRFA